MSFLEPPERVPVPLVLDEFDEKTLTYTIEMSLPVRVTLLEEFEAMVHDEILWNAHRRGLVPIGQAFISTRDPEKTEPPPPPEKLEEGVQMQPSFIISAREQAMRDRVKGNHRITSQMLGMDITVSVPAPAVDTCLVRAEILIGTAL